MYSWKEQLINKTVAADNPRGEHKRPLHSSKVTVWCGILRPFFKENWRIVMVTFACYVNMFQICLPPELHRREITRAEVWLQ